METTKKDLIRLELEKAVYSYNTPLKNVISSMDTIILLRNCHPSLRGALAYRLVDVGEISMSQAKEF